MEKLVCPICGDVTSSYMGNYRKDRLCKTHSIELKNGKIMLCEKCQNWHSPNQSCVTPKATVRSTTTQANTTNGKCIICEADSSGKPLCLDCYYDVLDREDDIDKNSKSYELREYYYNLKSNIYRMTNYGYIKGNCKKLIAIAWINRDGNRDDSLSERVNDDVIEILKKKKPNENTVEIKPENTKDSQKSAIYRTFDGHIVKSNGEKIVDDILYTLGICHAYEKNVDEIPASERAIKSDFYIPVLNGKGIYIEYWGMDTDDYQDNKAEKKAMYEKYDIPLIQIEKRDTEDSTLLSTRINREYRELAKTKYKRIID